MKCRATSCLLALSLLLLPRVASAVMSCTILSVPQLAFGGYNVFSGQALDTSSFISFRCTGVDGNIEIQLSRGTSVSFSPRTLKNGLFVLNYNVYHDANHTSVWGDGTSAPSTGLFQPLEGDDSRDVFGRIEPNQNAHSGEYTDTLIVTILF